MKDKNNISFERKVQTFFLSEKWKILNFSILLKKSHNRFSCLKLIFFPNENLKNRSVWSFQFPQFLTWVFLRIMMISRILSFFFQGREGANSKVEGPFTFQAILHNNGDIIFAYKTIPGKMFSLFFHFSFEKLIKMMNLMKIVNIFYIFSSVH